MKKANAKIITRTTHPKPKKDKISELKEQQKRWLSQMQLDKQTPIIRPTQPSPQPNIAQPAEVKPYEILADNWCAIPKKKTAMASSSCPICLKTLVSPQLVIPCGHSFCETVLII
jgi:Zinc finger, C3HC4 type (RING finger)